MTLAILDEYGEEITEDNPIITEHNGTTGDIVTLPLTLINKSTQHYHSDVQLSVNSVSPVDALLLIKEEAVQNYLPSKKIARFNPKEKLSVNLRLSVRPNSPDQVVNGIKINVTSMKFPLPNP